MKGKTNFLRRPKHFGGLTCPGRPWPPCFTTEEEEEEEEEEEFIFAQKPTIKMNKHVNKVRKVERLPVEPRPSQPVANKINNNT